MTPRQEGAWGHGLATLAGDTVLDTWFPEPRLGAGPPGAAARRRWPRRPARTHRRGVRSVPVLTEIGSLADPPADAHDAYLRLHLLSHRLIRPHEADLTGIFGVLPNVAWTTHGPVLPADLPAVRMRFRAAGEPLAVTSIDKFPRMTDYVAPSGVRIADADRVRLGAHLAEGTTVMHEGFVNYNAGTLGASMIEGRISAGVVVGDGSDIGGGASTMGTLSGGGTDDHLDRRADAARRQRRPRHPARRRLHRRVRPLPDGGLARDPARRRGGQGGRAERRGRPAVPAQLADRRDRGAPAQRPLERAQRRAARERLMLFRQADLAAIAAGEITVAFRRWKRPMARAGGTQQTPAGVLAFDAVERVDDVSDADARRAGLPDADAVRALLRGREGDLYRIRFHVAGPDPRIALRAAADLSREERAAIAARLARLDRASRARPLDGGDPARDRRRAGRARGRSGGAVRPRAPQVQDGRAQAQGARADREPRGRLPALAAWPRIPRRLTPPRSGTLCT